MIRLAPLLLLAGCYHYRFVHAEPVADVVVHRERVPTYLNGFVGTGTVDTAKHCADPVTTELRVTGVDVLISLGTLLIYTPHTLNVTCPAR